MKLYYPKSLYDSNPKRRFALFPLLKVFVKSDKFVANPALDVFGFTNQNIHIVDQIDVADVFILPMSWDFYVTQKKEKLAKHIEEKTALLSDREKLLIQREQTMETLERSVETFPAEQETAINSAINRKEQELTTSFAQEKALLTKGADGEQRVLETKISALESLVSDQARQIEKLNNQQEKAYQQVQDIAAKAVTGAAERPQAITVKTVERDGKNS